jgi:hypothetical protein
MCLILLALNGGTLLAKILNNSMGMKKGAFMKNRIYLFCIVSAIVAGSLDACDNLFGYTCEANKEWCEGDKVMFCQKNAETLPVLYEKGSSATCDSGKCVEFQWPGEQQKAGCLIPEQKCPEEGFEYVCDGAIELTCTPKGGVVKSVDCNIYNYGDQEDPVEGLAPTCVVLNVFNGYSTCALSKELCNDGDKKCAKTKSGRSVVVYCKDGLWESVEDQGNLGRASDDFPLTPVYSSELKSFTCAYSPDQCKDGDTMCATSTTGKKALLTCQDGLWRYGLLCSDCTDLNGTPNCKF